MKINNQHYRTIWLHPEDETQVQIIDQRWLPHKLVIETLANFEDFTTAIKDMHVRGAPLIGATAAYGLYRAILEGPDSEALDHHIQASISKLQQTRPTAVDLFNALDRVGNHTKKGKNRREKALLALEAANDLIENSVEQCRMIGVHGFNIIEQLSKAKRGETVNILTHCNAGWIACVDHGTATSPIYAAHDKGIKVHVWVDETRPRNQGARITAFELLQHGVPHTVIPDNTGGHLMQHGMVDLVIVGTDRTTKNGDVANKIGTYLKALAAKDNHVPFYVALPSTTFDFSIENGLTDIPIEQRNVEEVKYIQGLVDGEIKKVLLTPAESPAVNYGFDVTPARLVTGLITERGICKANRDEIARLFPEAHF